MGYAAIGGIAALLSIVGSASPLCATGGEYTTLGAGVRPCGEWLQSRGKKSPDTMELQSWVLGYVTSVNANVLTSSQDVSAGSPPDRLFSWIDTYCAEHPLDSVARATGALLDDLRTKSKAK